MKNVFNSGESSHILVSSHKRSKGREKRERKCEESTQTNFWLPLEEAFLDGDPRTNSQNPIAPNASSSRPEACSCMPDCGTYFQKGDVVGLKDATDGRMYYAQIRSFFLDQCRETSALLTWLLPSSSSPEESFDPATYFLGPKEETPRKLNEIQLICRFPADPYRHSIAPNLTGTLKRLRDFQWEWLHNVGKSLGPRWPYDAYKWERCGLLHLKIAHKWKEFPNV